MLFQVYIFIFTYIFIWKTNRIFSEALKKILKSKIYYLCTFHIFVHTFVSCIFFCVISKNFLIHCMVKNRKDLFLCRSSFSKTNKSISQRITMIYFSFSSVHYIFRKSNIFLRSEKIRNFWSNFRIWALYLKIIFFFHFRLYLIEEENNNCRNIKVILF